MHIKIEFYSATHKYRLLVKWFHYAVLFLVLSCLSFYFSLFYFYFLFYRHDGE